MTRVLIYQHMAKETPGLIGEWLERRGVAMDIRHLNQGEPVADPADYAAVIAMGGDMNVYQEEQYPWLAAETAALGRAARAGQAVLGVCLGGQLLAKALGAVVRLGAAPEIGVAEITLNDAGLADPLFAGLPAVEGVVWHDDAFDIPPGAVALASSAGCANQAFRYGQRAYGLQFHPEVTPALLDEWIEAALYLGPEDRRALRAHFARRYETLRERMDCLMDNFLRLIPNY